MRRQRGRYQEADLLDSTGGAGRIYFSSFLEGAVAWDENEDLRMADGRRVEMNISWQGDRVEFRVVD